MKLTTRLTMFLAIACTSLVCAALAQAQDEPSECVELGALAFENWTKAEAGGTGSLPAGVENQDYIRCKACHGWDRRGTDGGYVRRSRRDSRPNAGAGDGDSTSRAIETGTVTADAILHAGTGRSYAEGTGSWVALTKLIRPPTRQRMPMAILWAINILTSRWMVQPRNSSIAWSSSSIMRTVIPASIFPLSTPVRTPCCTPS